MTIPLNSLIMNFNFITSESKVVNSDILNILISGNYDMSGCIVNYSTTSVLNFSPSSSNSYAIPSISFNITAAITEVFAINYDNIKTTYSLSKIHIVPAYPYKTDNISTTQPTDYAIAIEFNSYSSPLRDVVYIYIPIELKGTNNSNGLLNTLLSKTLENNKKISLSGSHLSDIIPISQQYSCQSFRDINGINVKNIFFNNYKLYADSLQNISTILPLNTSYTNCNAHLKGTHINGNYYTAEKNPKTNKYINFVTYDLTPSALNNIYIDCSPVDYVNDTENQKSYIQKITEFTTIGDNLTVSMTYFIILMVIGLFSYFILKIPDYFKLKDLANGIKHPPQS
jgi:hypothetical protein